MNEITSSKVNSLNSLKSVPKFEKVHQEPTILWKKIQENKTFEIIFQVAFGLSTFLAFTAIILPASIVLACINFVALMTLGLCSPALLHPTTAKIWRTVKNKIFGVFTDLLYLPKTILITPLAFKSNVSHKIEKGNGPLIVFVHGFFHNKTCWETLSAKIQQETKNSRNPITQKDIYAINLGDPLTVEEIDHYARHLATMLEQIRNNRNLKTLDVILDGHSMGGLVSAHFATSYASLVGINVLRIISNGTPWHGTPMAYIGSLTKCGKEMLPDHSFHKELAIRIQPISEKIYTIASKGDTIVPYKSALGTELDIPEDNRFTLDFPVGHIAMQYSKQNQMENIRLIKEVIEK